jgi:transketolase
MENHLTEGGLGTAVSGRCTAMGVGRRVVRLGIDDRYSHGATRACLMREHGFDAMALIAAVEGLTGRSFGITEAELAAARVEQVHSAAKPEAL